MMSQEDQQLDIDRATLVRECANDPLLFCKVFFPKIFRQASPAFHVEVWDAMLSPTRYIALKIFRDSAKTTLARIYALFSVAYGLARTIVIVSKSDGAAINSLDFIKGTIEENQFFTETFGLSIGSKWKEDEIEIVSGPRGESVWVLSEGITGQLRGTNKDGYRPDLIIGDDIEDEENTATAEQRAKLSNLYYGSLLASLAPESDNPFAKIINLQTPLHSESIIERQMRDPMWRSLSYSCFIEKDGEIVSIWPERFSTETLIMKKESYRLRNELYIFMREYEVTITSAETSAFNASFLHTYTEAPRRTVNFIAIDLAPAIDLTRATAAKLAKKDFQSIAVIGLEGEKAYVMHTFQSITQTKEELITELFLLVRQYRPLFVLVESNAYQRTIIEDIQRAQTEKKLSFGVVQVNSKRAKADRIRSELGYWLSQGRLYVRADMTDLLSQIRDYPAVSHDDLIDATAMALAEAARLTSGEESDIKENDEPLLMFQQLDSMPWRGAP